MISVLLPALVFVYDSLRSRVTLQAEVLALRHQILVLQRGNRKRRVKVSPADRFFGCGSRVFGRVGDQR